MRIEFDETVPVSVAAAYSFFRSPRDWIRLYGAFGEVRDVGDGWFRVPLRRFPFPLVARITRDEPNRSVRWELRGFFRGQGQVSLESSADGVRITGFEEVTTPLPRRAAWIERRLLEPRFRAIWASGFRRLPRVVARGSLRP